MGDEVVMTYFKVLSCYSSGRTEKQRKPVRIAGIMAKTQTQTSHIQIGYHGAQPTCPVGQTATSSYTTAVTCLKI
jgi:hypothetical protein